MSLILDLYFETLPAWLTVSSVSEPYIHMMEETSFLFYFLILFFSFISIFSVLFQQTSAFWLFFQASIYIFKVLQYCCCSFLALCKYTEFVQENSCEISFLKFWQFFPAYFIQTFIHSHIAAFINTFGLSAQLDRSHLNM